VTGHVASARQRGVTDEELDALYEPQRWSEVFDDESVAALQLADALSGESHAVDAALVGRLHQHFDEQGLSELILVAGQANLNNRVGNGAKQLLGRPPAGS